ncbi:MAG: N-acetylmuramoyl-L-alanine amidase [Bacteroidales bacterium]|nr:N-acetylmuramoyl-L-alanine amidase [Bacteroidales bacterium]
MKKTVFLTGLILFIISSNAQDKIIVIDPGHNMDNTTTLQPIRTFCEVQTNWEVANKLKSIIETNFYLDWLVVLTRPDNNTGSNVLEYDRAAIANAYEDQAPGQVYFLSIHCNGGNGSATGTETFYCNQKFNTNNTLLVKYAQKVQDNMVDQGNWADRSGNRNGGVEEDNTYLGFHLAVLKTLKMPGCLNEIGFADNVDDMLKLENDGWRSKFAFAYFEALQETFGDLNVLSYSIINLPCFASSSNYCKISVTVKNITTQSISGDIRTMLRHFPMKSYETPTSDFCQLGTNKSYFLTPNQEQTFIFDSNIPITMETGMALCIESKPWGKFDWNKVHMPSHRDLLKVPLNGALIKGVIYNNALSPLQGAEMWSYQKPRLNSSSNKVDNESSNEISGLSFYPDFYDPTTCLSDKSGKYELLIPVDWNEAVVSVRNYMNFNEVLVSPITDVNFIHYYTTSPIIIGTGSGSGSVPCGPPQGSPGTTFSNPKITNGSLKTFEGITINGERDLAFVCKDKIFRLGVFPLPIHYSEISHYDCTPSVFNTTTFYKIVDCSLGIYTKEENCHWLLGWTCDINCYFKYFVSLIKCNNNLEYTSDEKVKWFEERIDIDNPYNKIGDIDIEKVFAQMNVVLHEGDIYRLKLAVLDPDWTERSIYFYVLSENELLENKTLLGKYYSANITMKDESVSSNVSIIASNEISILPNTTIGGTFEAYIDKNILQYSCTNQSSVKSFNDYNNGENDDLLNYSSDIMTLKFINEHRTVTTFSNTCSCENKKNAYQNDNFEIFPNPATSTINLKYSGDISQILSIEILNSTGTLMLKKTDGFSNQQQFNAEHFSPGVYCVRLVKTSKAISKVFIKN